jgi:hypothetical protein
MTQMNRCIHSWNTDHSVPKVTARQIVVLPLTIWLSVVHSMPIVDSFRKVSGYRSQGLTSGGADAEPVWFWYLSIRLWSFGRCGMQNCACGPGSRDLDFSCKSSFFLCQPGRYWGDETILIEFPSFWQCLVNNWHYRWKANGYRSFWSPWRSSNIRTDLL